jgi:hypothetical protein
MSVCRPWNKRGEKTFLEITYTDLENFFCAPRKRIQIWIQKGLLDPTNIFDIVDKCHNPWKLDGRRKKPE